MHIRKIFDRKKVVFSLEIFPPKRTSPIEPIYEAIHRLSSIGPDFISVTYGAGGSPAESLTGKLAAWIKREYGIESIAHLTCINLREEDATLALSSLEARGVENILALRGDKIPGIEPQKDFVHASDLIRYISGRGGFHVSAACHPEGHVESESIDDDIGYLKQKVEAGASHLMSQLFFDNGDFFAFLDKVEKAGIRVPVEAGIMPVINRRQIERMVSLCGAKLPRKFSRIMARFENDDTALRDAGIAYACDQIVDLVSEGVRGIHLYTMNNPSVALRVYENVKSVIDGANR